MRKTRNIKGIIYQIFNSGASDKVFYIINLKGSKLVVLAKGARKQNSKKSPSIEIGNMVILKIIDGYNISILEDIKVINSFNIWKKNIFSITTLQFIFEVISYFCHEEQDEEDLYSLLLEVLNSSSEDFIFILSIFLLKILEVSGHTPLWAQLGHDSNLYSDRIQKTQKFILQTSLSNSLRVKLSLGEKKKMLKLHVNFIENVIDKNLKSKLILFNILKI